MKIKIIEKNQTQLTLNNTIVLFSYETPVCFIDYRSKGFNTGKTNVFCSQTTTKHIDAFFDRHGYNSKTVEQISQEDINKLLK